MPGEPSEKKSAKRLKQFRLVRQAADKIDENIRFDDNSVPTCCGQSCRHFQADVCKLTGAKPERYCYPAVGKIVKLACSLDLVLFEDRGPTSTTPTFR